MEKKSIFLSYESDQNRDNDRSLWCLLKTKEDIPKDIGDELHIGDVILRDVAHTGVDMIATKNVEI